MLLHVVGDDAAAGFRAIMLPQSSRCVHSLKPGFTKLVKPGLREWTHLEDCGSMTELGSYGCFAVLSILGEDYVESHHVSLRNENGVDIFTKVFFSYHSYAMGLVKSGIGVKSEGELLISGTKGYILVKAPWCDFI